MSQQKPKCAEYAEYLLSPAWRTKRDLVLRRAGGICEGCRYRMATQVHHLTYAHIYNEFLWELVAICDGCHERIHGRDSARNPVREGEEASLKFRATERPPGPRSRPLTREERDRLLKAAGL